MLNPPNYFIVPYSQYLYTTFVISLRILEFILLQTGAIRNHGFPYAEVSVSIVFMPGPFKIPCLIFTFI